MWEQLTQADIERVRQLLATRRVEIVKRYEEELDRLDIDQAELERLARAVAQFAEKSRLHPRKYPIPHMSIGLDVDRPSRHAASVQLWTYRQMSIPDTMMVLLQR